LGKRLEAALARALDGDARPLLDAWGHATGLPGPRANLTLAATVAGVLADAGAKGRRAAMALIQTGDEYGTAVAAVTLGELATRADRAGADLADLGVITRDDRHGVSQGVVAALEALLRRRGAEGARRIIDWMDDLHKANLALSALADRDVLAAVRDEEVVVGCFAAAWDLAGETSRAADRSAGMRRFRRELPDQIALCASRFPSLCDWLVSAATVQKPEDREVLARTVPALRRAGIAERDVERIAEALAASAPLPRDPTRIREGTRRRGRRRR
jgi:hypothetical protein